MKKSINILYLVFGGLVALVSVAFAFIEARILFSGEWMLFESKFLAFLQCFLRFSYAVFALAVGVFSIIKAKKKSMLFESFLLLVISCVGLFFYTNFVGEALFILSVVYFIVNVLAVTFGGKAR